MNFKKLLLSVGCLALSLNAFALTWVQAKNPEKFDNVKYIMTADNKAG